jgi:hypothetical protein
MIPPQTILEMHQFMRDELRRERQASESCRDAGTASERRLGRFLRTLLRRPRQLAVYSESNQLETAAVRTTHKAM